MVTLPEMLRATKLISAVPILPEKYFMREMKLHAFVDIILVAAETPVEHEKFIIALPPSLRKKKTRFA